MLAARRRPGKLPEGFYAAAEKEADRAMHTAVRKESRPRPRPLSNKTDWSHAKIKIGPRHQASLPRLDRRRPPPAEGRGGSPVADPAALEREMAIRGKDWSPETSQKFERAVRKYGDDLDKIRKSVGTCVEINQCDGCTRQFFTKSFLGDDAAVPAPSGGDEPAPPRHRAGVASMAWRTTR